MENYLLGGNESGDIKDFINKIIKENPDSEVRKFISKDSIDHIMDFLSEESLFVPTRICVVTAVADLDAAFVKFINVYMKAPKSNASLILNLESFKVPVGIKKGFPKDNINLRFYTMYDNQRASFVRGLLSKERITIDSEALNVFLDMCENTKLSMKITVDQITAFIRSKNENAITREHLLTFLSHTRVENIQSLYFAILERRKETAIRIVRVLLHSRSFEASMISISLGYSFLSLLKIREAIDSGTPASEAISTIKYFKLKQLSQKALNYYNKADLENIMFNLANIDIALKESDFDMKILLLENLVLNIINKNFYDKDYFFTETL